MAVALMRDLAIGKPELADLLAKGEHYVGTQGGGMDQAVSLMNKQGFATNWYYPVLTGVVDGEEARRLILDQWDTYVVEMWGCKCVSSAPWVTVAETTELIMTLCRMGQIDRARLLMEWMLRLKDHNGGFHTGIKLPEMIIWPEEKNTWTSAGVIMATMAYAKVEAAHAR